MENYNPYLLKAEDPQQYKALAEKGIMVGHPVTIAGQTKRPDIGIGYHSTVKFFDPDKDKPEHIHDTAKKLNFVPPDPKKTGIEPGVLKDRAGNDVFVIKLHGEHADQIKDNNSKFSHLGFPKNFEYKPHVSVDKGTWDKIVASKAKTAHEAGMSFGPAQLKHGPNVLATYHHNPAASQSAPSVTPPTKHVKPEKLAASENMTKSLSASLIRETVTLNADLKSAHLKSIYLDTEFLSNYLQDNPGLEEQIVEKHEQRLKHHFGNDTALIQLAWEKGLKEAYKSLKEKK